MRWLAIHQYMRSLYEWLRGFTAERSQVDEGGPLHGLHLGLLLPKDLYRRVLGPIFRDRMTGRYNYPRSPEPQFDQLGFYQRLPHVTVTD
jgi:hypothetical protein